MVRDFTAMAIATGIVTNRSELQAFEAWSEGSELQY